MKVAICVPSGDMVTADFWLSFSGMLMAGGVSEILLPNVRISSIQQARQQLVYWSLERSPDKILFIDSDMAFPEDAMMRLLRHDRDIVGALYPRRKPPHDILGIPIEDIPPGASGLWEMARVPTGMLMVNPEIFSRIEPPWFPEVWHPRIGEFGSDDYGFSDKVREAGYKLWADLDLSHEIGHNGMQTFTWARNTANS